MAENLNLNSSAAALDVPRIDRLSLAGTLDWSIVVTLAFLIILGFGLRVTQLGAVGFAEDEMNKLDAIHAYERGDFTANSEHPMIMKLLMWASVRNAPLDSEEARLRLPNALIGALTVVPIFLLTLAFFDKWTALLAAAFWAVGINAITHNRIGKEDSLLVFFMLFGFFFFVRAKQISPVNHTARARRFVASAVSFGLMIASKYFPHYFGLNMLFHHKFHMRRDGSSGPTPGWFYLLIIGVFLVASPAVLLPDVWRYMDAYMGERLLTHSGYLFAGELYKNNMSSSPFWGTPIYFYLLFLAIKVPLATLIGFLVGLVVSVKRRNLGHAFLLFMFLFWIVPYSLIGGKWLRYTLTLMPFVYMLAAVGVVALIRWTSKRFTDSRRASFAVSAVAAVVFVCFPAWTAFANRPHYALYTNALAADKAGYYFPHDEFYDDGLREAIKFVCENAPRGATIAHETPGVVRHYLSVFDRTDLVSKTVSSREFDVTTAPGPVFVIVQNGRTYFENTDEFEAVRGKFSRVHEVKIRGVTAAEVFKNR